MFRPGNKKFCKYCGTKNSPLYKKCIVCKKILDSKFKIPDFNPKLLDKIKNLAYIHEGLKNAEATISLVPNEVINYLTKFRYMYILVVDGTNGCEECLNLLKLLIEYNNNMDEIIEHIINIGPHIENYEENSMNLETNIPIEFNIKNNIEFHDDFDDDFVDYPNNYSINKKLGATSEELECIKNIPVNELNKFDDTLCTICLDTVKLEKDGNLVESSILPCGHVFHKDCILLWLDDHNLCPNGRCIIKKLCDIVMGKIF